MPLKPGPARPAAARAPRPAGAPWAARAHLRYVADGEPGITRLRSGRGFRYRRADGRAVHDPATLARIRALVIPPAWTAVWICLDPRGHIQAVGRDARGRKQYRYHPRWRQVRDGNKFGRMLAFARALPRIRRAVARDLRRPGLPRPKVLATIVRLLERTAIRVGGDEYARTNHHFGLTTLLDRHVAVDGRRVRFRFRGKSGKQQVVALDDARLAHIVRRCQDIPGQRLFQYLDHRGRRHAIGSTDVNRYIREICQPPRNGNGTPTRRRAEAEEAFTAKDFRTWSATVCVTDALLAAEAAAAAVASAAEGARKPASARGKNRQVLAALDAAAERLGNTRAVCRSAYVHPRVIDAFIEGWIQTPHVPPTRNLPRGLDEPERATVRILASAVG
jgi:DNA topoisomerase I